MDVVTVGVYGWTEETFFAALQDADVATFCDVRRRRGVRGHEYAFANSNRLQARLGELSIAYVHRVDLSPSLAVRRVQEASDAERGIARRARTELGDAFVRAYDAEVLDALDAEALLDELRGPVALFCVEREPTACHRGLLATRLAEAGATVTHLTP